MPKKSDRVSDQKSENEGKIYTQNSDPKSEKTGQTKRSPIPNLSYEDFRKMFVTKAFTRTCPYFCIALKCPFLFVCWDIKPKKEVEQR